MKPGEAYRAMSDKLERDILSTIIAILSYPNGSWDKQLVDMESKLNISNELHARANRLEYYREGLNE